MNTGLFAMGYSIVSRLFKDKIAHMQALVDEALGSGGSEKSMEEIFRHARSAKDSN